MKKILMCAALVFTLAMLAFAVEEQAEHPIDMGNTECITCHADADVVSNPAVVAEYNKSLHNFAGVACGSCHGDAADFVAVPTQVKCEPCHTEQVAVKNSQLTCQSCHTVHTFAVHMR
jgi:hypothetical protein